LAGKDFLQAWARGSCREVCPPPEGVTESEMAMFYLLNAIEDIALYLEEK